MITLTVEPPELAAGRPTRGVLRLRNTGSATCITVIVEFEPSASLILERGRRVVEIDRLAPGAQHDHAITLQPLSPGAHHLTVVNFSFRDGSGIAHYEADRTIEVTAYAVDEPPAPAASGRPTPARRPTRQPTVFISHRRNESQWFVDRLVDHLRRKLPRWRIYFDRETNRPGEDFQAKIDSELRGCVALLALIGPDWATAVTPDGRRRLDEDDDVLRREVATALGRAILVIPVLYNGARMPGRADLPADLHRLANRHAAEVDLRHFEHDVDQIVAELRRILGSP